MHSFFVDNSIETVGQTLALPDNEREHAARVLRLRKGERVRLLDGRRLCEAELMRVDADAVEALVAFMLPSPEPPMRVTLWQGLPKADKLEWIAQKGTELGMDALMPVAMERSVTRADKPDSERKKRERLSRIALEAAKQSARARVPEICATRDFNSALKMVSDFDAAFVLWEEEHALPLSRAISRVTEERGAPESALLIIGPEGGISRGEYARLTEAGAIGVTLGRRILRTETAGLCALSLLWAATGEM